MGGKEQKLTERFDHTDGPDYSPDGEWIWFNGAREGSMNLWRMRHDGSDLERMIDDCSDDWFPIPHQTANTCSIWRMKRVQRAIQEIRM